MTRKKRQFLEDDDSSDSNRGSDDDGGMDAEDDGGDPDLRDERAMFEDPYKRKKRMRTRDANLGVFGEDDEDEGFGGRGIGMRKEKRRDWTKAPAFVSGGTKAGTTGDAMDEDEDGKNDEDSDGDGDEDEGGGEDGGERDGSSSPTSSYASPSSSPPTPAPAPEPGRASSEPTPAPAEPGPSEPPQADDGMRDMPTAFGMSSRHHQQRSFLRSNDLGSASKSRAAPALSAQERLHFNKLQGSFGARMLAKMGWEAGTGLGADAAGIVTPVEGKLRPSGIGIAFKGFKERTEQSRAEAKRRGEVLSEDEDGRKKGREGKKGKAKEEVWKKPKKTKVKVVYKTYEEILAEEEASTPPPSIGIIIDATGATPREVSSLADISTWAPERIPEVRHNIRLIAESCKHDLDALAKQARALRERRKWVEDEDVRVRKRFTEEAELIQRLQKLHLVVDELSQVSKDVTKSDYEPSLEPFSSPIEKLVAEFSGEIDRYRVDEIVVAAIVPTVRRALSSWVPLQQPDASTAVLRKWKKAFRIAPAPKEPQMEVDVYGSSTPVREAIVDRSMTPYESMMWSVWLPKVRSCINNDWPPENPHPIVQLYEAWSDLLPAFVRDNVMDQLILPKVSAAIAKWTPKKEGGDDVSVSLRTIVFPWLPHLGLRWETFMDEPLRRLKAMLKVWKPADGVPPDLLPWKDVIKSSEWEGLMLRYIVPKLGATMRDEFRINPRNQVMDPLQHVLAWSNVLKPNVVGQIFEQEFFPKWLDVLHFWLIQPNVSYEEITRWYQFWKGTFPENLQGLPEVDEGFRKGLQLMNEAMGLGAMAPTQLAKPVHKASPNAHANAAKKEQPKPSSRTHEITFRSIVEEFISTHNLLFMPAGRVHEKSRLPLFRISKTVDGKGGMLVYLLDDAVWDAAGEDPRAVSLEDVVLRVTKG